MSLQTCGWVVVLLLGLLGCSSERAAADTASGADADSAADARACGSDPSAFYMDFARASSLFDAPIPSDDLRLSDGHIDVARWPNPAHVQIIAQSIALVGRDARGFAQTGAIYLRARHALDPTSLPDLSASIQPGASVFVTALDPGSADYGRRLPVHVAFLPDGGPHGASNLLAILPLQGAPLRPATRYAAVVTTKVRDATGAALPVWQEPCDAPSSLWPGFDAAAAALPALLGDAKLAGLTVFTTDNPASDVDRFAAAAAADHPIAGLAEPPTLTDVFDHYCVFESRVVMPVYQHGQPPYSVAGGGWSLDAGGLPAFDHSETARIWLTVPRQSMPASGWPTMVFIGTGAGGERGLVDRGFCADPGFTGPEVPGSGPADEFASVGWAGVQVDGTLLGIRNTTGGNEDLLLFNFLNPEALRDNLRQSALELTLLPSLLQGLSLASASCPGAPTTSTFDPTKLGLMGHSMGASIAPLVLHAQPAYRTAILSGAGGSFLNNIMYKQLPLEIRPIAESLLGYDSMGRQLSPHDPALTLVQWAAEPADVQIYARRLVREPPVGQQPRNILMIQGIVDHYILPAIANATSLSMGLDLGGPPWMPATRSCRRSRSRF